MTETHGYTDVQKDTQRQTHIHSHGQRYKVTDRHLKRNLSLDISIRNSETIQTIKIRRNKVNTQKKKKQLKEKVRQEKN